MLKLKKYVFVWQITDIAMVDTVIYCNMRRSQ